MRFLANFVIQLIQMILEILSSGVHAENSKTIFLEKRLL